MRVLITGGSRGIGRAIVRRFTAEGHSVVFIYKQNHEGARELCALSGAQCICADISDPASAAEAAKQAALLLGGIDVLVNNAGISQIKTVDSISDADWQSVISTNLSGAFYLCRAVLPYMIVQKSGRIISIGSMWGKIGASCEVHYSASKAGLRGLTMALAKEVGPSGITVNAVEPGVIETEMNASLDADTVAELCDATPLCRLGKPEEVAALVSFLASDEAGFITGQMIGVDGGFAI